MSSVMIYFDHHWMDTLKRNEQYSLTDFLAGTHGNILTYRLTNFDDFMFFYDSLWRPFR